VTVRPDLGLVVITDRGLAAPHPLLAVVEAALAAGAPAVQLRDKTATARELYEQAEALLALTRRRGALLFVNDRLDVALAAGADGVHLGPGDLPVRAAPRAAPAGFLVGYSTADPGEARAAERAGADYIGCGAVFGTLHKEGAATERIGTDRLAQVIEAVTIPVVGIGGITADNAAQVVAAGAAGAAVIGAVMQAGDPAAAVRALLAALGRRSS
jgi:thiamine-phosphate pyrophosphorylase